MISSHQTAAHDMESDTRVINRQSLLSLRAFYVVHEYIYCGTGTLSVAGLN